MNYFLRKNKMTFSKSLVVSTLLLCSIISFGANKTFTGTGNFSSAARWGGVLPVAGDNIRIDGNCTIDAAAANLAYGILTVGRTVAGTLSWTATSNTNTLNVLSVASKFAGSTIDMTNGGVLQVLTSWAATGTNLSFIPGTGTVFWNNTVTNSTLPTMIATYNNLFVSTNAVSATLGISTKVNTNLSITTGTLSMGVLSFTCAGTTSVSGTFSDGPLGVTTTSLNHIIINSGGKINNATNQVYTIGGNFTMLGGSTVGAGIPVFNIAGNFLVLAGTNTLANVTMSVTGTTSVSAVLNCTSASGTKTLNNLTIASGGAFNCTAVIPWTINGNIQNNGTASTNTGMYTITGIGKTISGTSPLSFANITCSVSSTYTNNGNVIVTSTLKNSGTWTQGTTGVLSLSIAPASFTIGTFNASTVGNTVNYSLSGAQNVIIPSDLSYGHLSTSGSGIKTQLGNIVANGNVTIGTGTTLDVSATNYSLSVGGNWANSGTFTPRTGTVLFTGSGAQTLLKTGGELFNNIIFSNAGPKTLLSNITCKNFLINAGSNLDVTASNYSVTVTGNWSNSGTFTPQAGTVLFTGAAAQTILKTGGETFNNITFTNAGAKTLLSNITCKNFLINAGSNLDVTAGNYSVTVNGTWSNAGTFTPRAGTVLFTGAIPQTILKTGGEVFNNVTFSNAGTKTLLSNITCKDFLINTGSNLDVTASNFQVTIKGNFTNSGTLTTRSGTILFNGATAQTIGGTSITNFYDLTLNNILGAGLNSAQNLINTLTITTGTLSTNTQSFTMISTASNTARVAAMTGTGGVSGNVIVQRYAPGGNTGWALLGTPISSALTLQDWNDNFPISCASCPNGSAAGFISIYTYNEAALGLMDDYTSYIPMTAITDPIIPNKGYWVYLGTGSVTSTPILIDVTGTLRQQAQSIPLSYSAVNTPTNDGWNLIHNPYPSPISWSSIYSAGTNSVNLDNAIYAYNADLTGGNAAFVNGISSPPVGSGGIGDAIPMCEGFFVHATAAKTLNITEANKTGGNPTFLKTTGTTAVASSSTPLIRIYLDGNSNFHDETVIYSQPGATNNFDYQYDALKLNGQDLTTPTIRLNDGTNEFQINGIDINASNFSMPLKTITGYSGTYTISMANFNSFPTGACFTLFDKYTNTTTDLTTSNYVFTLLDTTTASRFLLNITVNPLNITSTVAQPSCVTPTIGQITAKGLSVGPWNYYWKDAAGTIIKTSLNKTTTDTISNLLSGNYALEIHTVGLCDNHTSQFTINVVDIPVAQFAGTDTTYMSNSGLVTFTNSSTNSTSNTWDFGDMIGTSTTTNPSYNYISAGVYTVTLISQSNSGCLDTATQKVVVINNATDLQTSKNNMGLLLKTISNNEFVISGNYTDGDKVQITVNDILGKNILDLGYQNSQNMQIPIDLSFVKPGVYYLTINGDKHKVVFKLPVK